MNINIHSSFLKLEYKNIYFWHWYKFCNATTDYNLTLSWVLFEVSRDPAKSCLERQGRIHIYQYCDTSLENTPNHCTWTYRFFRICQLQLLQQELYSHVAHALSLMTCTCTWTPDFTDNATITKCIVLNETTSDLVHCTFYIK